MGYREIFAQAQSDPEAFWLERAQLVDWVDPPRRAQGVDEHGVERWFPEATLNTCYNALDRHVLAGRGEQVALYYDSPVTDTKRSITYAQLLDQVARCAGGLAALGVGKGDRVVIYLPMVPEAVIAMLACARLGAIHSVVFGGFAPKELAVRLEDASPKVLLTATGGLEPGRVIEYMPIVNQALAESAHAPAAVVVLERPEMAADLQVGRDISWHPCLTEADPIGCVPVAATDPLYILYTSGTTGKPKGVVRDNGGHAVALTWSMQAVYGVAAGDVFWAASDVGWVVGHSYIVYGPLMAGCTTVLYEGKPVRTPDPAAFWRVVEEYRVKVLFAAPTAFRAIRKEDPEGSGFRRHNCASLDALYLAGERLDPPTYDWLNALTGLPVIDHWWQTETGWAIACNPRGLELLPTKAGSTSVPSPGFHVAVLDAQGRPVEPGVQGAVVIRRPMPPGCLPSIWGDHARFEQAYFARYPGYYLSGDGGYLDADGYLFIMGRTDDVINVAGHRLSTGEMEEVVAGHPAVAECAVIGVQDALKGQLPLGLVVLKDGVVQSADVIEAELIAAVRSRIGAVASFNRVFVVARLPKTRSGKILRATLRKIADGESYSVPSTIEDPSALDEIAALF